MATIQQHEARLNFRLSRAVKERVERAALLSGQSVSDFAASALARSADDILQRYNTIVLADQDRDFFLALLDREEEPSVKSQAAAARYRMGKQFGNEYHG